MTRSTLLSKSILMRKRGRAKGSCHMQKIPLAQVSLSIQQSRVAGWQLRIHTVQRRNSKKEWARGGFEIKLLGGGVNIIESRTSWWSNEVSVLLLQSYTNEPIAPLPIVCHCTLKIWVLRQHQCEQSMVKMDVWALWAAFHHFQSEKS